MPRQSGFALRRNAQESFVTNTHPAATSASCGLSVNIATGCHRRILKTGAAFGEAQGVKLGETCRPSRVARSRRVSAIMRFNMSRDQINIIIAIAIRGIISQREPVGPPNRAGQFSSLNHPATRGLVGRDPFRKPVPQLRRHVKVRPKQVVVAPNEPWCRVIAAR